MLSADDLHGIVGDNSHIAEKAGGTGRARFEEYSLNSTK